MIERIKKIAVIGSGTMGRGIAQVCAAAGYDVLLYDIQAGLLKTAISSCENNSKSWSKKKGYPQMMRKPSWHG